MSIAGGLEKSVERALDLDLESFQIFSKNQRQWRAPELDPDEVVKFRKALDSSGLGPVVVHDSYLINLGSPKEDTFERSKKAFSDELFRAESIGAKYLVMHPGSHLKKGEKWGLKRIAEGLDSSIEEYLDSDQGVDEKGKTTTILLENTAGQGTNLGYKMEHLAEIMDLSKYPSMLAVCFDTCHAFTSGIDFTDEASYGETFDRFQGIIGLENLKVFHLNDSKNGLGSRIDRHANLGEGEIGEEAFGLLVNDHRFSMVPLILETPGGEEHYRENLEFLRALKI